MMIARRTALIHGAGALAWCVAPWTVLRAAQTVEIEMRGRKDGSRVWFDPIGLWIPPGTTIRWTNRDPGNAHTATAYHPEIGARQRRIPASGKPWDSGYLLPGERFDTTLNKPGVYDYYCLPHEHAGMVGRIVVGDVDEPDTGPAGNLEPPAAQALSAFPTIGEITLHQILRPPE